MKISRMDEIFEERGFTVVKRYDWSTKEYLYTITKNGITVTDAYKFMDTDDMELVDKMQHDFIERLINAWRKKTADDLSKSSVPVSNDLVNYVRQDVELARKVVKRMLNSIYGQPRVLFPQIENVIFNDPATIVFWNDGTKTVVKTQDGDVYDPEKGLAMAISKKALGNNGSYYNVFKKWLKKVPTKNFEFSSLELNSSDIGFLGSVARSATEAMSRLASALQTSKDASDV